MTWVEIIRLRSSDEKGIVELAEQLLRSIKNKLDGELRDVRIYRSAAVPTDLSVHLSYETETADRPDTGVGEQLTAALDEHGLTDRSLWAEIGEMPAHEGRMQPRRSGLRDRGQRLTRQCQPCHKHGA